MTGCIIFDLDGTLIDSRADLCTGVNLMRQDFNLPPLPLEQVVKYVGNGTLALCERALAGTGVNPAEALPHMKKYYREHLLDQTTLYPGVADGLRRLHDAGFPLAVISNKLETPSKSILEALGVGSLFQLIVGGDSGFKLKPDPESLLHGRSDSGGFDHATVFRQIAEQDGQAALFAVGVVEFADDGAIGFLGLGDDFAEIFTGDGETVQVELAVGHAVDFLENGHDSAGFVHVFHVIIAGGRDFADIRRGTADFVEFFQIELNSGFVGYGEGVQHGIGTAAHGHIQNQRVMERFFGCDLFGQRSAGQGHCHGVAGGGPPEGFAARIDGDNRAVAGEGEAERFAEAIHAVGRIHAGTGTGGRAAAAGQVFKLVFVDFSGFQGADAFEN